MKNTTPIPAGIASPDRVETRLGTLSFFDGFPDDATVQKLYDNLDFQRAVQAYLLALPAVNLVATRKGLTQYGPENSTLLIWENRITPRTIWWLTQNVTPYSAMWIDLKDGPLVVEIPPKLLGFISDMWGRWVVDFGFIGPDKGQGGKYLLVPPGYKGEVPEGYIVVRPKTFEMNIFWRSFLDEHGDPKPGVDLIKKTARVYPLSKADSPPEFTFVNVTNEPVCFVAPADYTFWEYLNDVVQSEPSESLDPVTLGFYRSIGIKKGMPFAPDERMKAILVEAAAVGDATARALTYRMREKEAYFYENSAWRTILLGGYEFLDNGALILDSYSQLYFFGGLGISPAMEQKMVGQGSQYAAAFVDAEGRPFDGGRSYKLHLPTNIPVNNFWSVTVYDNQTRSQLQTDQDWPALNSQNKGLALNGDGSADIYFGPEVPAGKENNWIQTIPGKGWNVALRLYGPLEPWFDKTWRPGEIEPIR
ncbi:DUF1254 domain-containing protein [Pontibacter ruber]|uniref:DUF1254 domain-containing protein n=1 Tax=Pontibacter ruber TaxID=1343895 RepID=A0ABW5CZG2_9BACT|nr:DUF1254 domain-containing protein [Pontibacter ruber]